MSWLSRLSAPLTRQAWWPRPGNGFEIEAWLDAVAQSYNVLSMDADIFRRWARLMHQRSDTLYEDAMIAATAQAHGLTVVTRNVADFKAPQCAAEGIESVWVNGVQSYSNGQANTQRAGRFLARSGDLRQGFTRESGT